MLEATDENLAAVEWLASEAARPWLEAAGGGDEPSVAELARLRAALGPVRAAWVAETRRLRHRGRAKFAAAGRMFFTPVGLEQATDDRTAAWKARRFSVGTAVLDLCAGIGGDLVALAARGPAKGLDRDPLVVRIAAANLSALGCAAGRAEVGEALDAPVDEADAWHVDPDRRPQGRRTSRVALGSPSQEQLDALRQRNGRAAIKLAPAADVPPAWAEEAELEWISRDGECRQLVAWFGALALRPGQRAATVLRSRAAAVDAAGPAPSVDAACGAELDPRPRTVVGRADVEAPVADELGPYLYEPDAAVRAAGLGPALAVEHGLAVVDPAGGYLSGRMQLDDPALAGWAVDDVLPLDVKRLKSHLRARGIGRLEIKKRGVELEPEQLRRQLAGPGAERATLLVARHAGRVVAIVGRRLRG